MKKSLSPANDITRPPDTNEVPSPAENVATALGDGLGEAKEQANSVRTEGLSSSTDPSNANDKDCALPHLVLSALAQTLAEFLYRHGGRRTHGALALPLVGIIAIYHSYPADPTARADDDDGLRQCLAHDRIPVLAAESYPHGGHNQGHAYTRVLLVQADVSSLKRCALMSSVVATVANEKRRKRRAAARRTQRAA